MHSHPHRLAPRTANTRASRLLSALAFAVALSSLSTAVQAQSTPVASTATSSDACPQPATILQNAYPAARPDPQQTDHPSYLLGDRRLMLPGQSPGDTPFMFCKVWPAHDKLLLVGVPRMDATSGLDIDRMGDLDILVVDRASLKVQQRLTLPDAMSDDAIRLESMSFDTARYVIAPGIQAFGLRASYNGASRPNPFSQVTLRLFAMGDGSSGPLRMVLDAVSVSHMNGEWDTNCRGEFSKDKTVLAMTTQVHNGVFDIRATKSSEDSKTALVKNGSDCEETIVKREKTQHTLVYDGKRYVIPDALKAL